MVSSGEGESCLKRTRHLSDVLYGQVGQTLYPYLPGLGVQVGQHLMGFRPGWSPSGFVRVRFPAVSGLHVHVIRPSFCLFL